jgi:O-antigen/teichoic acid export membrane protein
MRPKSILLGWLFSVILWVLFVFGTQRYLDSVRRTFEDSRWFDIFEASVVLIIGAAGAYFTATTSRVKRILNTTIMGGMSALTGLGLTYAKGGAITTTADVAVVVGYIVLVIIVAYLVDRWHRAKIPTPAP